MKRRLTVAALGLILSPAAYAADEAIWLKGLLKERAPEFQAALQRGIDATSGVHGAGGAFFPFAEADLNGDQVPELLVAYGSSYFSGSAGNYPVEIFARQPAGEWRWLGRVWGREGRPLVLGRAVNGWLSIRFEKNTYCWRNLAQGDQPSETGYAGHVPEGGMYALCSDDAKGSLE